MPRYTVVGYIGSPQAPVSCCTLAEARVVRDLNGGRILNSKGKVCH